MDNKTNKPTVTDEFNVINGGVTDNQIAAWKGRHGRVHEVEVTDPDVKEIHKGYFRRPDMKTMEAVSAVAKQNEVKGSETLFNNCWLGGSEAIKNDAIYKMEAMTAIGGLFGKCMNKLKNL